MINTILSITVAVCSAAVAVGTIFMFKGLNVKREYRFKQHLHIIFTVTTIAIATVLNLSLWIVSLINDKAKGFFERISINHTIPILAISTIIIFKVIYKIYFNQYIKNHLDEIEDHLPKQYYEKDGAFFISPYYHTATSALKIALVIIIVLICIGNGTIYYLRVAKSVRIIASFETFLIIPVFIYELYSYFDGTKEKKTDLNNLSPSDVPEARTTIWADLDKEYSKLWKNHLLGRFNITDAFEKRVIENTKNIDETSQIIAKRTSNSKSSDFLYSRILSPIMRGNNFIVESCLLHSFSNIIVPIINIMFSASKRMMFLCDNSNTVKECAKWLEDLDIKSDAAESNIVIDILDYEKSNTIKADGNIDLYIGTVDMALNSKAIYENIDVLICINIDKIITENALSLNLLASVISSDRYDSVQYVLFGNRVNGLRPTASQIFMVNDFEYQVVNPSIENDLSANFWLTEKGWLQAEIVPGFAAQFIGQLIPLAIPPFKFGFNQVNVISSEQSFSDQMVALQTAQPSLKKYMGSDILNLSEAISFNETENFVDIKNKAIVVVGDTGNNAALVLLNWLKYAKQNMFLNIVSSPYLLRDYIVSNIDFFIGNVECIGAILPVPKTNIKLSVYRLINQLCYGDVAEETLLREIKNHETGISVKIDEMNQIRFITESLQDLTQKAFNATIFFPAYLKSEKIISEKTKESKRYYKLLSSIKKELPEKLFKNLSFVDSEQSEKVLKRIPVFELYQNYLEGQYVAFEGKFYLIDKIDYDNGLIELTYSNNNSSIKYRQCRNVTNIIYQGIIKEFPQLKVRDSIMKKNIISADLEVNTEGYYEFNDSVSLVPGGFGYKNVDTNKKGLKRVYKSTNVLSINISNPRINSLSSKDQFKLSFTLSVMLNELFETLFSSIKQYIIARTVINDADCFKDYKQEELIRMYRPIIDSKAEKGITLYFTEDTELEKGITDTIVNNFDGIIKILFDYLFWLLKEEGSTNGEWHSTGNGDYINIESIDKFEFLKYGNESIPEVLDLNAVFECLCDLTLKGEDTLTFIRKNYIGKRIADDPFKKFEEILEQAKKEAEEREKSEKEIAEKRKSEKQSKKNKKKSKKGKYFSKSKSEESAEEKQFDDLFKGESKSQNSEDEPDKDLEPENIATSEEPIVTESTEEDKN